MNFRLFALSALLLGTSLTTCCLTQQEARDAREEIGAYFTEALNEFATFKDPQEIAFMGMIFSGVNGMLGEMLEKPQPADETDVERFEKELMHKGYDLMLTFIEQRLLRGDEPKPTSEEKKAFKKLKDFCDSPSL